MKIIVEPSHWKILLEEGDKMVPSLSPPKEITTIKIGYARDCVEHWVRPIQPVPLNPQVALAFDAELHAHAHSEHLRHHPLDLYSIIETDSEPDEEPVTGPSRVVEKKRSKLGLHQKKADGPKVWRVSGTGKFTWANNVKVNLNRLSKQKLDDHTFALRSMRRRWNKNLMLRPVLKNHESWGWHYAGDPTCRFEVDADNVVTTHYYDLSEIKMFKPSQWAISDEYGSIVTLNLRGHPEQQRMNEAMDKMRSNWQSNRKLRPVLQRGFNKSAIEHLSNEGDEIANNGVLEKPEMVIYVCQDAYEADVDVFGNPIRSGACGGPIPSKRKRLSGIINMDKTHYLTESDTDTDATVTNPWYKDFPNKVSAEEADDEDTDRGVITESESDQYDEPFPLFPVLEVNMDLVHGNNNEDSKI